MPRSPEPDPPEHRAALLVRGSGVTNDVLELLRVEFEALLEDLDRGLRPTADSRIDWNVEVDSLDPKRIFAEPVAAVGKGQGVVAVLTRLSQAIESLQGKSKRPPGFTKEALFHLGRIVAVIEEPGISGIAYYASRRTVRAGPSTLENLRKLSEGF